MPLSEFICPDKSVVYIGECLQRCVHGKRCLTLPTLKAIASDRELSTNIPDALSTTELLSGTCYEYLKKTVLYKIDPKDRAYALLGMAHHQRLQEYAEQLNLPNEFSLTGDNRNVFDLLEEEVSYAEDLGHDVYEHVLTDYKTWGSFKVGKFYGMTKVPSPITGKNTIIARPENRDRFDVEMQMNRYRVLLEQMDTYITHMQVQITVRDGGLAVAKQRGITELMYLEPIDFIENDLVREYFERKQTAYQKAIAEQIVPEPCTDYECWDGMKCARYCEVWDHCVRGRMERDKEKR